MAMHPTTGTYYLSHANVDGAGPVGYFDDLDEAKADADRRQAAADARDNNPWGYTFKVTTNDRYGFTLHRTHMAPHAK